MSSYIHGYSSREHQRLQDQAATLADLLHSDTLYPNSSSILEVGCGVGAQTVTLAQRNPTAIIRAIDIHEPSLRIAEASCRAAGLTNVQFQHADLFASPLAMASFDHAMVCFVLEHLREPVGALQVVAQHVRAGGTLTIIEGDHGSAFFHPDSAPARRVIDCQVHLQAIAGGSTNIGRMLYPLLKNAGFSAISVSPRMIYVDGNRPQLVDGFTRDTFIAMIEGIRPTAVDAGLITAAEFDLGIRDLRRTLEPDGVFCYTFFKAVAVV